MGAGAQQAGGGMAVPKGGIASMLGGMSPGMGRGFADGGFVDARMANPMMGGTGMAAPYGDTPMGQTQGMMQPQAALAMYDQLQGQPMGQPNPFDGRPAGMVGAMGGMPQNPGAQGMGKPVGMMGGMPQPAGQMMPRGGPFAPPLYPQGAMDYQPRGHGMPYEGYPAGPGMFPGNPQVNIPANVPRDPMGGMPQGGMGKPAMGGGMPKPIPPMGRSELKRAGLYTKPGAAPMPQGQGIQPQSVGIAGALPPGMMPFR